MPKATWGDFSADDIEKAEVRENQFTPYNGPLPRAGLYRFTLKVAKKGTSQAGNPKLLLIWELDGSWKPEHKKYDGAPLFDHMPVTKSSAFRARAFCDALGMPYKEFQNGIITDEDGKVTKLGRTLGDPAGLQVYANISRRPAEGDYDESLQIVGTGYLPIDDDDVEDANDGDAAADDDADDDSEPPF
jgi:hypothetical protein